ncbi:MAG TPA: hypothetical protein VGR96_10830 [Acidobacteriaceae bacterium]|nr:hypothetical protein [Acidobacteriaceae bacterium]
MMIKRRILWGLVVCGGVVFGAGCNKTTQTNANYEKAINNFYKGHPACLWPEAKKFPVQAATSDESKTEGYDALTDSGLLARTTAEKKVFIVASKQVNNYDISDKGRSVWTQDPTQPGYGNFCYGHREVTSIDSSTPANPPSGGRAVEVNYHYKLVDVAPWANSQEMKTAFPDLNTALSGPQAANATVVLNGDDWDVVEK